MWFAMNAKWRAGKVRGPKQARFCRDGAFGRTYLWGCALQRRDRPDRGALQRLRRGAICSGSPFYFVFAVTVLLNHHALDYWLFFGKRAFDY